MGSAGVMGSEMNDHSTPAHTATLPCDGKALGAGSDHTAELYDPAMGTFTVTGASAGA